MRPEYRRNLESYYQHLKNNHLTLTVSLSEVKGDQRRLPWQQPQYLQVVKETDAGVIVRGMRRVATAVPYTHEIWTHTLPEAYQRPGITDEEAAAKYPHIYFIFAVPVNAPGVKIICRPSEVAYSQNHFDCPVSWYDEIDGMIVYEDVLVPWERLFSYGSREFLRAYGPEAGLGEYAHCIAMVSRMELLVGAAYSIVEKSGLWDNPVLKQEVTELAVALEATRACLRLAETEPEPAEVGMAVPSTWRLHVALHQGMSVYTRMLQLVRDLGGGSVTTNQSYRDLTSPEIGPYVEACFLGAAGGRERLAVMNLVEDLTASEFAARKEQFVRFSLGPPHVKKLNMAERYDWRSLAEKVERVLAAGQG